MQQKTLVTDRGFTLIELMIVISIIGILSVIAIPNFISFKNKSYCIATLNDADMIAASLAEYFALPSNRTTTFIFHPAAVNPRPYITIGPAGNANTLLLSASTTNANAISVGSSYLITVTEGAANCPMKVINADTHWQIIAGAAVYSMTL